MSKQSRSITDGTCALNGVHTPGSEVEAECPLNPNRAAARRVLRKQKATQASPAQLAAWAAGGERLRKARQKDPAPLYVPSALDGDATPVYPTGSPKSARSAPENGFPSPSSRQERPAAGARRRAAGEGARA